MPSSPFETQSEVSIPSNPALGSRTEESAAPPLRYRAAAWLALFRPRQWVKNAFVLAPLLFSGRATDPAWSARAAAAFGVFCLLASGVYALNDVVDRQADRLHPAKRTRPVAAGIIGARSATLAGLVLLALATVWAGLVDVQLALVAGAYVLLNLLYAWRLKEVVILDVFVLASFFVLRLVAGAAAIDVRPSIWLLLCGGLLALYLGFAKRRHELHLLEGDSVGHRRVLGEYGATFLDQMSAVLLAVTVVAYIMYTLASDTAAQVGSDALTYSTVFVLYGVFRYLYLVHERDEGSPTETLLMDRSLMVTVALWLLYCGWVIYRPF